MRWFKATQDDGAKCWRVFVEYVSFSFILPCLIAVVAFNFPRLYTPPGVVGLPVNGIYNGFSTLVLFAVPPLGIISCFITTPSVWKCIKNTKRNWTHVALFLIFCNTAAFVLFYGVAGFFLYCVRIH